MPKLSVIVPVFNVEQYLSECIDSILAQTMCDFELILIDDGSPDRCGEICDKYAQMDSRIIVIHQKNQGVSSARNAGLEIAKGEYIGFVDSDDLVNKVFFQKLISVAELYDCDIACCDYLVFKSSDTIIDDTGTNDNNVIEFDRDRIITDLFSRPSKMKAIVWNKIIKKSLLGMLKFDTSLAALEDLCFLLNFYSMASETKACFVFEKLYNYRINNYSISRKISSKAYFITKSCFYSKVFPLVDKCFPSHKKEAVSFYLDFCSLQINDYKMAHKLNGYDAKKDIRYIKASLLAFIMKSTLKREMNRHTFNRHTTELLFRH